jgi:hypothetical protein
LSISILSNGTIVINSLKAVIAENNILINIDHLNSAKWYDRNYFADLTLKIILINIEHINSAKWHDRNKFVQNNLQTVLRTCSFPDMMYYSGSRLIGSLWDRDKLIPITD